MIQVARGVLLKQVEELSLLLTQVRGPERQSLLDSLLLEVNQFCMMDYSGEVDVLSMCGDQRS
jgi:hypothetical protein